MPKPGGGLSPKTISAILTLIVLVAGALAQRAGLFSPPVSNSPAAPASQPAPSKSPATSAAPSAGRDPKPVSDATQNKSSQPAAPATSSAPSAATLRIASWNIEWLGKPEDRSGLAKGVAQSADDMADYIKSSDAAIVAVEEVVSRERGLPIRSREIEAALVKLHDLTGQTWEYVLFPGRADGDQLTGVLWNRQRVTAISAAGKPWDQTSDRPWALPIPKTKGSQGSYLWNRPPHAMKFSAGPGKTDVVLIVLHMKADYSGDFSAQRKEEADALLAALPEVRKQFHDQDIILLGDTNCPNGPEAATKDIEGAGFADLNTAARKTHWQGGTMDRAFVPADQPEFKRRGFDVLSDAYLKQRALAPKDFKRRYSDHFMIVTTVDVGYDDD